MNNELSTNFKYTNLCTIPVSLFVGAFPAVFNSRFHFFPWEYTLETECEILWVDINIVLVVGCKTLYVCAFYNLDEGDAISLENFERSLQQIGGNTSSHVLLSAVDSRRHDWISLEAQLPISNVSFP